jgi:hypothetical protein
MPPQPFGQQVAAPRAVPPRQNFGQAQYFQRGGVTVEGGGPDSSMKDYYYDYLHSIFNTPDPGQGYTPPPELPGSQSPDPEQRGAEFRNDMGIDNPQYNAGQWNTPTLSGQYGQPNSFGPAAQGMQPTYFVNYPNVGQVPMAIPPGGWSPDNTLNVGTSRHTIRPNPV